MPSRKLGHLQKSVLELAAKHQGRVSAEIVYRELYDEPAVDAATRMNVSRVLWSLQKRGLIRKSADHAGFELES
jgi:Fe2+ or Zn2+ uptake regulation protein